VVGAAKTMSKKCDRLDNGRAKKVPASLVMVKMTLGAEGDSNSLSEKQTATEGLQMSLSLSRLLHAEYLY
jgi:hypothetical protein